MAIATLTLDNITVTNAGGDVDLIAILPATQKPIEIVGWYLVATSEVGDAAEEIVRIKVIRGHTTVGSGGAAVTPRCPNGNDSVSFTARANDTTIASAGTAVDLGGFGLNERIPEMVGPLPDGFGFRSANAEYIVLRMMSTVADDISLTGTIWVREL